MAGKQPKGNERHYAGELLRTFEKITSLAEKVAQWKTLKCHLAKSHTPGTKNIVKRTLEQSYLNAVSAIQRFDGVGDRHLFLSLS